MKPLPSDPHAELCSIGSILLAHEELDESAQVARPEDYTSADCADTLRAMLAIRDQRQAFDVALIRTWLVAHGWERERADEFLLQAMESVPHGVQAKHYAEAIRDLSRRRTAAVVGMKLNEDSRDQSQDTDEVLARAETDLHRILEGTVERRDLHVSGAVVDAIDRLDSTESAGVPTGIDDLDALTGGLPPGSLTIVGARPSAGKTMLLCGMLLTGIRKGVPGLLFSLEQSRREIVERLICSMAGVSSDVWKRKVKPDRRERDRIDEAARQLCELPLFIDDQPGQTLAGIRATARLCCRRHGVAAVSIDYLQLIESQDRQANREQQIAQITRGVKLLARDLNIPVVLAAQLNRELEKRTDKRPQLSDLRESGAIEQDADLAILLDPQQGNEQDPVAKLTLRVAKHRNGEKGDVKVLLDRSTMTLRNAAPACQRWGE